MERALAALAQAQQTGDLEVEVESLKRALAICNQLNAKSNQSLFSLRLGADYLHMGQFERSKELLEFVKLCVPFIRNGNLEQPTY